LPTTGGDAAEVAGAEFAVVHVLDRGGSMKLFLRFRVEVGIGRREQPSTRRGELVAVAWKVRGYLSKSSFGRTAGG
jgi:hypothetical protein